MNDRTSASFETLEEPVTLASSSAAMLTTREDGRVVGFGCIVNSGADPDVVIGRIASAEAQS